MTQNNNAMMQTIVETFIIEETQELLYDNERLGEWNSLVSELGLKGQTQIVKPTKSPVPYLFINSTMARVFETLCPRKVDIAEYNATPIPVEILSLVGMSKKEGHFNQVQIWYDDKTPDPFCIGILGEYRVIDRKYNTIARYGSKEEANAHKDDPGYYTTIFSETGKYLIGRWGDVKMSIDALTAKAKALFMAEKKNEYTQKVRDYQRKLEDLELEANEQFGNALPTTDNLPF